MVNRNSLTHKLVAIISLALVVFVIVVISILVALKSVEIKNQTVAETKLLADLEAAHLSGHFTMMIEKCKSQAVHFQKVIESGASSRDDADEILQDLVKNDRYTTSAWVVFKPNKFDGKDEIYRDSKRYGTSGSYSSWYHTLTPNGIVNESLADFEEEKWYDFLVDQKVPLFLDPYSYTLKSGEKLHFISIAFPIFIKGEFVGYTGLDIDIKYLQQRILNITFFEGDYAALISPFGFYAIHPDSTRIGLPIEFEQFGEAALKSYKSGNKYTNLHRSQYRNKEVLDHFLPLKFEDINQVWFLQISVPSDHVDDYLKSYITKLIIISVISVIFVVLLIYIVLFVLLKPITKISDNLIDLAQNGSKNASVLHIESKNEIGVLVSSYNMLFKSMVEKEKLDREIFEVRYHSDTALKLAKSGTFYIDVANNPDKFYPSESTLDILGLTLPEGGAYLDLEMITRDRIKTNSETGNRFAELLRKTVNGDIENPDLTYQATRADDHSIIWLRTVGKVIKNSAGEVTSILGVVQDITEQKQSQEALIAKEENFRNLFEQSVDAIIIFRPENLDIIDCNSVAISLFSQSSKAEFLQVKPKDVSPEFQSSGEYSHAVIAAQIEKARTTGSAIFEYEYRLSDGKAINCIISMGCVVYNGEPAIQTNIKDITAYKEIEHELTLNETRLSQVIEIGRLGFYELDLDSKRFEISTLLSEIVGVPIGGDSTFESFMSHIYSDDYNLVQGTLKDLAENNSDEMKHIEFRYNHPQKGVIWLDCGGNIIYRKSNGSGGRQVGYIQDITERKMQTLAVKESEERYAFLAENINESLWRADLDMKIKYITSPIAKLLGYAVEEVISQSIKDVFTSDSYDLAKEILDQKIDAITRNDREGWESYTIDVQMYSRFRSLVWIQLSVRIVSDGDGKPFELVGIARDISAQKIINQKLEKSELLSRIALTLSKSGSWYIDPINTPELLYCTPELMRMQGLQNPSSIDYILIADWKRNMLASNPEVGEKAVALFDRALHDPSVNYDTLWQYTRVDNGEVLWFRSLAEISRDDAGKVISIVGVTQDVTEHKLNELKIQEVNQNLNMALNAAKMGVWKYDFVNDRMETDANTIKLYELSENEVGDSIEIWFSTLHSDDVNRVKELMRTAADKQEKNYRATFRVKRKDGSYKQIISIGEFFYGEEGKPLFSNGLVWDISEIQEAQDNMQRVLNTVPVGVAIYDRVESELLFMSNTLRSIMEVEPDGGIGFAHELSYVDAELRDTLFSEFDRSGYLYNRELQINRYRTKEPFWAYLSMLSFKYYDRETVLIVIQDITEMKALQMDILSAKEQAEAANVAKSAFLANMSHEIRTPMNSILGFSEILYKRLKDPVDSEYIESIRSSGQTLMSLISDILDFSKIEAGRFVLNTQPTDIHKSVQEISDIYNLQAKDKGLEFTTIIADSLPQFVVIDDLRLKQVLLNFLGNALKFTAEGRITIEVDCKVKSHNLCDVTFRVSDSGIGISKEDHLHIFEAFKQQEQQDNRRYGGTGLGLSISNNLVELMGGKIELESEKGQGSRFYFTLSDIEIVDSQEFVEVPKVDLFAGNQILFSNANILVVDDIASNQALIIDLLADKGLSCLGASSAVEAIEAVIQNPPDLIFMDIFMPEINGYEAMKRIRKMDNMQGVPIIAVTASYSKKESERAKAHGFDGFIAKPVNEPTLLENLVKFLSYKMIPEAESGKFFALDFDMKHILENSHSVLRLQQECEALFIQFVKRQSSRVSSSLAIKLKEIGGQTDNAELEQFGAEFLSAIETFNIEKIGHFRKKINQLFELL